MVKFTNAEFNEILKVYHEFEVDINRGNKGYIRPWSYRIYECMNFKYSDSQFKKLVDYTFEEPLDDSRILKILIMISDEEFPIKCISAKAYEYYVKTLVEKMPILGDFEWIFSDMLYFRDRVYARVTDEKSYELEKITLKYADRLNFTEANHIKDLMAYLSEYEYCYRGYNGAYFFNGYLRELEKTTDLDFEEFEIEDNIENYLWKDT